MPAITPRYLSILDTTLRDGDQAAGYAFSREQKIMIAHLLEEAGVDCVEVGFPQSSAWESETCRIIASDLAKTGVMVMTRARIADIRASAEVLSGAKDGRLHLSLPVSRLHIHTKLRKTESEILSLAVEAVSYASGLVHSVEIGAEDATRTDRAFLLEYCQAVTEAGAHTVNIADTVGYTVPHEFSHLIQYLMSHVEAFSTGRSVLSVHCHNDFGLANANTLAGIHAGCGQIELTCMGIGERAGNASLEEMCALLHNRRDLFPVTTSLDRQAIERIPDLISRFIGTDLSPLKPVTGRNNHSHASGIHQHGIAANRNTYTPFQAESETATPERIVISRHSGIVGLSSAVKKYTGLVLDEPNLIKVLEAVKSKAAEVPTLGATELLEILNDMKLIKTPLWHCSALTVTESLSISDSQTPANTQFSAKAEFQRSGRENTSVVYEFSDVSWPQVIVSLIFPLFPTPIKLKTLSFSGYGSDAPTMRLFIEAAPKAQVERHYALERTGKNRALLLLECLLDIVNVENCLTGTP